MMTRTRLALAVLLSGLVLSGCSTEGDLPSKAARAPAAPINSIFVSRGDTLYKLAQQYNVPVRDLIEANGLSAPYMLQPGQRLLLPLPKLYVVKGGDTLYGLSRLYQVDMAELVRLNGLQQPYTLKAGQTLRLPGQSPMAGTSMAAAAAPPVPAPRPAMPAPGRKPDLPPAASSSPAERTQRPSVEVATLPPPPAAASTPPASPPRPLASAPAATAGAAAAGKRGVEAESLPPSAAAAPAQNIPHSAPQSAPVTPDRRPASPPPVSAPASAPAQALAPAPVAEPPPAQVAAVTPPPPPPRDEAPPARAGNRFLWPVRGPILSGFGEKPGGLRNDGINIGAPKGTAVMAAENGIVAYAGNQLKSFGNLVLIRHDCGWVTVYAHLDAIAVEQGQRVTRGQGIGTVGQTGNVRSAQLHFAVRKGEQVLNPVDQMEK